MKKFNLLLFASLLTSIVIGQNNDYFEEIPGTPFDGVYSGSVAFADIDNDNDQDVLITGNSSSGQPIAKLYRNITVSTGDIERNTLLNSVSIYPNPNRGLVNINLGSLTDVSVKVLNLSGQLIYHKQNINTSTHQFEFNEVPGIYIIVITSREEKQHFKLIKN